MLSPGVSYWIWSYRGTSWTKSVGRGKQVSPERSRFQQVPSLYSQVARVHPLSRVVEDRKSDPTQSHFTWWFLLIITYGTFTLTGNRTAAMKRDRLPVFADVKRIAIRGLSLAWTPLCMNINGWLFWLVSPSCYKRRLSFYRAIDTYEQGIRMRLWGPSDPFVISRNHTDVSSLFLTVLYPHIVRVCP